MNWLHPWFLIALSALAVPVIVHFFNLRRYRKVLFTNVRMLRNITRQERQRKNLLHRIVLASRLLALAALVIAFAGPISEPKKKSAGVTSEAVCIFLDNSFSMEISGSQISALEEARRIAREIVKAHPAQTRFCLSTNSAGSSGEFVSAKRCIDLIDETAGGPGSLTLTQIINRQNTLLREYPAQERSAYIISDFRSNLKSDNIPRHDSGIAARWISIPVQNIANISIDTAWLNTPLVLTNRLTGIEFSATNHSENDLQDVRFSLNRADKKLQSVSLNIPAGKSATGRFEFTPDNASPFFPLEITTTDEGFPFDNKLYLSLLASPPVTIIRNQGSSNPYLEAMLGSSELFKGSDPGGQALYVESALRIFTETQADQLAARCTAGGSAVLIPAAGADLQSLNPGLVRLGFAPFKERISVIRELDQPEYNHPFFKDVFTAIPENSQTGSSANWYSTGGAAGNAEVLQRFRDGNPAVLLLSQGKGRVVLFTMPWDDNAREYLRSPIPLTILANTAIRKEKQNPLYLIAGSGRHIDVNAAFTEGKPLKLQGSDGNTWIAETAPSGDQIRLFAGRAPDRSGLYRINKESDATLGYLALNYNRSESAGSVLSQEQITTLAEKAGAKTGQSDNAAMLIAGGDTTRNISRWLLLAALLFLCAESVLLILQSNKKNIKQHSHG